MDRNKPASYHHAKAFHALGLFMALVLVKGAGATQFRVGDASGWTVPSNASALTQWAERNRFQIGDSLSHEHFSVSRQMIDDLTHTHIRRWCLVDQPADPSRLINMFKMWVDAVFFYRPDNDSVLQVQKEDYDNCSVDSPIATFKDGNTIFSFDRSGSYFFISGVKDNCLRNEKLAVVVMADRSNYSRAVPPVSPSPSHDANITSPPPPSEFASPPSPSNSTNFASPPSPSASGSPESNSPIAPAGEESPPPSTANGASSKVISFLGCFSVLGSSLLFVL